MRIAAVVALVPLLATSRVARADPDVAIGFAAGPNLPSGEIGGVVQVGALPWLAVEAGAGRDVGEYVRDGTQTSLALRVRTADRSGKLRVFVGLGESMGRIEHFTEDDVCFTSARGCKDIANGFAVWTDLELGVELELEHTFARIYGGVRWLDDPAQVCVEPPDPWQPCRTHGFFGVAVGARL